MKRIIMTCDIQHTPSSQEETSFSFGTFTPDSLSVAKLFYSAYHETIDDEGESIADWQKELRETADGKYGPLIPELSFQLLKEDHPIGAIVTSTFHELPLLLFVVMDAAFKGYGLSKLLMSEVIRRAKAMGLTHLYLVVTVENQPSFKLYEACGFSFAGESWADLSS
ncbi:GNAT family N-acetyltransferase [Enterococcus entomosocium]|uniref:GNAT family N-acetyltransferase n=1 Tax=Enterococcus entomosocium TaxID=3034352 RepID=UPI003D6B52D3